MDEDNNKSKSLLNLKDDASFLEIVIGLTIEKKVSSSIYLVNGIKLVGRAVGVDSKCLLFQRQSEPVFVVSLSAIASFTPEEDVVATLR